MPNASRNSDEHLRLRRSEPILRLRHAMLGALRAGLNRRGFLEVSTPVRIATPALEDYIDAERSGEFFLRTSPELHMKRLLAAGYSRIFQLGPCFRHGERGKRHLPEFTMLEWYRLNADYRDILRDTLTLLPEVARQVLGGTTRCRRGARVVELAPPWEELTVADAFARYAECAVDAAVRAGEFERILVERIEPQLGRERPTVLLDYPVPCGGLARANPENPERLERWELYIDGLEIANACSELADADEQCRRFAACAELRRREGRDVYPLDHAFIAALREGMPPAAGIAVGVDRLLMILADAARIDDVVAFIDEPAAESAPQALPGELDSCSGELV